MRAITKPMNVRGLSPVALAVIASMLATEARAQAPSPHLNIEAAEIAAAIRAGTSHRSGEVFRQSRHPQPAFKLDAIADSVAHIAITHPGDDLEATRIRARAVGVLHGAGRMERVFEIDGQQPRNVRYAGAEERLVRIAENAQDPWIIEAALWSLLDVMDTTRLVSYLRKVVTYRTPVARTAAIMLHGIGPEPRKALFDLYRTGLITEPGAREIIDGFGKLDTRPPNAAQVAANLRTRGEPSMLGRVLEANSASRQRLDSIADTLMHFVIWLPGNHSRAIKTREAALNALANAGIRRRAPNDSGRPERIPYDGATDRLTRILEEAQHSGIPFRTYQHLGRMLNEAEFLQLLRRAAISEAPASFAAIQMLAKHTGPNGAAMLTDLCRKGLIPDGSIHEYMGQAGLACHDERWQRQRRQVSSGENCQKPSAFSAIVKELLTPLLVGADSISAQHQAMYNLPRVSPAEIAYRSDPSLCKTAALAIRGIDYSGDYRGVFVLAVGPTRYVAFHPGNRTKESRVLYVFDSEFKRVGAIPY